MYQFYEKSFCKDFVFLTTSALTYVGGG